MINLYKKTFIIYFNSMGIKYLLKFLDNYNNIITKLDKNNFNGEKVAIDISIILYQVIIAIRNSGADLTNNKGEITSHILGLFNKTISLLKNNIIPIFVFDGIPPKFKQKTIQLRKELKYQAYVKLESATNNEERIKYFKRTVSISKEQLDDCKELLDLMGIPYITAPAEADSQCAYLVKSGIADGVITEDMDILTFGAKKIYRNLISRKKQTLEIKLDKLLETIDLTYEQFIEFCILLGCDYCDRIKELSPTEIYNFYYKYKNIPDTLERLKEENIQVPELENYIEIKNYFLNAPYVKPKRINLNKPDIYRLENILVNKYGLIKSKIKNKINYLDSYYNKQNNLED